MSYLLDITLDGLPPTVNHLYRSGGGHWYKTAEGAAYQEMTASEMWRMRQTSRVLGPYLTGPYLGDVALHIVMTARTRRKWDLDNRVKAVQDCLQMAGIIKDDSQITELVVRREMLPKLDRTRIMVMTRGGDY